MPSNSIFQFQVYVNGQALPEYEIGSDVFVEANLYSPVSYYIEENGESGCKQRYPVTPFTVRGSLRSRYSHPCYLKMSVDGQQVYMKPFPAFSNGNFTVNGYKRSNEIRELLFSLPRIEEEVKEKNRSSEKTHEIGTIKVECLEAVSQGQYQSWGQEFRDCSANPGNLSSMPVFNHASKKDCSSSSDSVGVATREGRSIAQFVNDKKYMKTMIRYQVGKAYLGKLIVKYRPRLVLQELGITNEEWETSRKKSPIKEDTRQEDENRKIKDDTDDCKDKIEKMNCFSPTRNHDTVNPAKLFCFSPCNKLGRFSPSVSKLSVQTPSELQKKGGIPCDMSRIKQEIVDGDDDKQYRLIQIDDDVQMLEEIDDDIVWMGDQSCCFVDVEPPEIPMIDLSGD